MLLTPSAVFYYGIFSLMLANSDYIFRPLLHYSSIQIVLLYSRVYALLYVHMHILTSLGAYNSSTLKALSLSPHPSLQTPSDSFQNLAESSQPLEKTTPSEVQHILVTTKV